jgi:preprotein translocase subunit SecG
MSTVLLIIQLIISVILTGLILIQRSEGGALGIGGGGGGGLMSGRSATTSIARMTGILGAIFLVNCLALSIVFQIENRERLIIDDEAVATQPADPTPEP